MNVEDEVAKDLPEKIMKMLKFRYGAVTLDNFEITDVRFEHLNKNGWEDQFGIFLKLEKKGVIT